MNKRAYWLRRRYTLVVTLTLVVLFSGSIALVHCHDKIGDPFLGFFFGQNLLVSANQRSVWPGILAGVKPHDRIVSVDGYTFKTAKKLGDYLWDLRHQDDTREITVALERQMPGGRKSTFNATYLLPRYNLTDFLVIFVAPCSLGFIFLALGICVFFLRPRQSISLVYFFFCTLISLACITLFESYSGFMLAPLIPIYPLIGAVSFHLFTLFPERLSINWLRKAVKINYLIALLILTYSELFSTRAALSSFLTHINAAYVTIIIMANFYLMLFVYRRTNSERTRDKLKVLGFGLLIASTIILMWSVGFLINNRIFYLDQAMLLFLLFPLFLAYAILKKNILDINRVMRTGISYGLLGGGVLALYLTGITLLGQIAPQASLNTPQIFFMLVILAGIFFANSIGIVQRQVMQVIFKGRYNTISNLKEFTHRIARANSKERIYEILIERLVESLGLTGAALLSRSADEVDATYQIERMRGVEGDELLRISWQSFLDSKKKSANPVLSIATISNEEIMPLNELRILRRNHIALVMRIDLKNLPPVLVLLGERRGDKHINNETMELLNAIANQASISLENAEFFRRASEKDRLAALGKVASIIVHEIKNPLGIIRVSSETIKKRCKSDEASSELATIIDDEVTRMNETIQQFLNFAKPDQLLYSHFTLNALVEEVVRSLKTDFATAGIAVETKLQAGDEALYADREKIRRVLYNLLLNAKEAVRGQTSARIALRTHIENSHCHLRVEDNGKGMDDVVRRRLFQPFFTTRSGGSGLGLAIVQQIVNDHKGEIQVNSKPETGTQFNVALPLS